MRPSIRRILRSVCSRSRSLGSLLRVPSLPFSTPRTLSNSVGSDPQGSTVTRCRFFSPESERPEIHAEEEESFERAQRRLWKYYILLLFALSIFLNSRLFLRLVFRFVRSRLHDRHGILLDMKKLEDPNERSISGCLFCKGIELRGLRVEKPGRWIVNIDNSLLRISLLSLFSSRLKFRVDSFMDVLGGRPASSGTIPNKRVVSLPFLHADGVRMILFLQEGDGDHKKKLKLKKKKKRFLRIDMLGISNMTLRVVKPEDDRVATFRVSSLCSFRPLTMTADAVVFDILFRCASEGRIEPLQYWSQEFLVGADSEERIVLRKEPTGIRSGGSSGLQVVANLVNSLVQDASNSSFSMPNSVEEDDVFVFSKSQYPEKQLISHSFVASIPIPVLSMRFRSPYDTLAEAILSSVKVDFRVEEDEIRKRMSIFWKVYFFASEETTNEEPEWTFEGTVENFDISRARNRREVLQIMRRVLVEDQQKELVEFLAFLPQEVFSDAVEWVESWFPEEEEKSPT